MISMKARILAILAIVAALVLAGCSSEAEDVDKNLTKDADNFKIVRRVTFVNGITDKVVLEISGLCSVDPGDASKMSVKCKTNDGKYVKHFLGKSDNVFWTVEQLEASDTSASRYRFVIRAGALLPEVTTAPTK
jgi:hypothetical protein